MSDRRRKSSDPGLGAPAGRLADGHHPNPVPRLDEEDRPAPDVRCKTCAGEIPHGAALYRDVEDYSVWFCSEACRVRWDTEHAS
ncbi:MAG: hypothetical protein IT493_03015 [Gammaproteobacteria bacterium]|nr:hypothetical protein [Gammaproteobacteria bacterium]